MKRPKSIRAAASAGRQKGAALLLMMLVGAADVAICFAPSIVEYIEDLRFALRCG